MKDAACDALGPRARRGRGAKSGGLECWTSAVEAEVWRTGQLVSKRMDVLVSRDFRVSKGTALITTPSTTTQSCCMFCCEPPGCARH